MKPAQATRLVELLEDAGHSARLYPEYSGRGMYGESTTGVVTDGDIGDVIGEVGESDAATFKGFKPRRDNLGLETIYY